MPDAPAVLDPGFDRAFLMRIEDAGINASAPPQQLWQDGWLVRFSAGKAKRARCVNAVAPGLLPLGEKLRLAGAVLQRAALPLICRVTPFSHPGSFDADLADLGFAAFDDTRVMVCTALPSAADAIAPPAGLRWVTLPADAYAQTIGALRGSTPAERRAHAERLQWSPVPYHGVALQDADGAVLACGQMAQEAEVVGLYDVFTRCSDRGRGLAALLCHHLLLVARRNGAVAGYLQVESNNLPARAVYRRLGFTDAYSYRYRQAPEAG